MPNDLIDIKDLLAKILEENRNKNTRDAEQAKASQARADAGEVKAQKTQRVKEVQERIDKMKGGVNKSFSFASSALGHVRGLGSGQVSGNIASKAGNAVLDKLGAAAKGGSGSFMSGASAGVGIVVAWAAAMTQAAPALRKFTAEVVETNKRFAEVSPTMANLFAQKEVRDMMRTRDIGEKSSSSAKELLEAQSKLEDASSQSDADMQNLKNKIGTVQANVGKWFQQNWTNPMMDFFQDEAKRLGVDEDLFNRNKAPVERPMDFPEWLEHAAQYGREHRPQKMLARYD